jgi:hypothetical protein
MKQTNDYSAQRDEYLFLCYANPKQSNRYSFVCNVNTEQRNGHVRHTNESASLSNEN